MITIKEQADHVEIAVAAPITTQDVVDAGVALRQVTDPPGLWRVLVVVESIGLPNPRALWEDLKLTPLITRIRWVALVTDIEWYAHLSEISGALWPGLTIKHFEPSDVASAQAWLADQAAAGTSVS